MLLLCMITLEMGWRIVYGAPDLPEFRLVNMFTRCTHADVKSTVVTNFTSTKSHLRIVVATIAFAMRLDCPDVQQGEVQLMLRCMCRRYFP